MTGGESSVIMGQKPPHSSNGRQHSFTKMCAQHAELGQNNNNKKWLVTTLKHSVAASIMYLIDAIVFYCRNLL
jgi:hypothetical protein